jgi:F-type H+-transporting ATPase subunit a
VCSSDLLSAGAAHAAAAHGEEHHDAHAAGHGDDHGHDPYHLPNFVSILFGEQLKGREAYLEPIYSAIIAIIMMTVLVRVATKRTDSPGRLQVAVEMLMGGLDNLIQSVIGPTGRRYTPYLGTLFIFIWLNNLSGLVPLFHASTSVLNTTAALGICTFVYVQAIALKENGIGGYLFHMAGSPRSGVEWGIMPLMFVLHLTGEFIKPMSLSLRLFGNVMGEDKLLAVFVVLGAGVLAFTGLPIGIPFHVPIVFLALLTGTIQALVFTLLSMVYIALMLPHDEHHGEAHAH